MPYKSFSSQINRDLKALDSTAGSHTKGPAEKTVKAVSKISPQSHRFHPGSELNTLFDNLDAVLFSVDMTEYKLIHISSACEKIYGYEPGDFYENHNLWQQVVHPEDKHLLKLQVGELSEGKKVVNLYRIITKKGDVKWLENKIIPTLGSNGQLIRLDGISTDISERKYNEHKLLENENRLMESEKKYRFIFENSPMPMWLIDAGTFCFLDVNKAAVKHYGYSREEFLSMSSDRLTLQNHPATYVQGFHKTSLGQCYNRISGHLKKDGTVITVETKIEIVEYEGKKAQLALLNDVTEQIKSELQLLESNERYELVTRATSDAIWDWNLWSNELYWSEGYEKLFGYKDDGSDRSRNIHNWTARIHPDDVGRVTSSLVEKINNPRGDFWEDEYRYIKADGSIAYIYDRGYLIYEDGIPVRMVGAMQDITKRKLYEQLLREKEANLRTIFDTTDTSYIFMDTELKVVSFNHRAQASFFRAMGNNLEVGRYINELLPEEKKETLLKKYRGVLKGVKVSYEADIKQEGDAAEWYSLQVSPVYDGAKKILGIVVSAKDITARKNADLEREKITSELIQRNKTLEQFAYIISHNLRSPVANITGLSNIILNSPGISDRDQKRCMEGLALSVRKLDDVIIDLNHILQVRREVSEPKTNVRFSALIKDIKTSINTLIEKEGVVIQANFIHINTLFTIKSYLNSIFYNLIINSIKYRNPAVKPIIKIESFRTPTSVILTFRDNGLGIDMNANSSKVFGLYKKFHPHIEGKGMGLYMVKTQVEMLGGKIELKSEVNKGCEFIIEFDV